MTDLISALHTPVADEGTGFVKAGMLVSRVDGRDKVTGAAHYAGDIHETDILYGVVVNSDIGKGSITDFVLGPALSVSGVVDIITHTNRPKIRSFDLFYKDMTAPGGSPFRPLYDENILYSGQPVALVLAQTFEAARYAASLVEVHADVEEYETELKRNLQHSHEPGNTRGGSPPHKEKGDAEAAYAQAPFKIEAAFDSATQHHNPMELFATTVLFGEDGHLTIYDKTQSSQNSRWYVSRVFGLSKDKVTVRNPYVGGAFGAGLRPQYQLPLAVMAALKLQRSVKVVMTRQQMFGIGHRPETVQTLRLAADHDGNLKSILHKAITPTSRYEEYVETIVNWSGQLYACDNIKLAYELVNLDQSSPMNMRAPGAAQGLHALEVAVDELAYQLHMDPLAFRLKNYAELDPTTGLPYSTKELRACYQQGADRFGWQDRLLEPRSMREGHELIGYGMATGMWDAMQLFARASAVFHGDGQLVVSSAASDIGTGTYTAMTIIAATAMGLPLERVIFQLGDSTLPVAPVEGGSSHVTTIGSAVQGVCEKLQNHLFRLAKKMPESPFSKVNVKQVEFIDGGMRIKGRPDTTILLTEIMAASDEARVEEKYLMLPSVLKQHKYQRATHSAVFCEVRVDEDFGTVRVTRVVSAIAAGQIISAKTARSQITGGVVWGISQALHEASCMDHKLGRFMNHSFAEYHVAVNADIHDIDVIFVEEDDRIVSRLGAKGVGEIGMLGVAAAISNAIFHATGRRLRSLPMTPDKVMASE